MKRKVDPLPGLGFQPDPPAVALDDALAQGEADPGAGVLLLAVETLEDHEQALEVPGLDADAVVADLEGPEAAVLAIVARR